MQQMACMHCEELIHRYAARCPYCQGSVSVSNDATTPVENRVLRESVPLMTPPPIAQAQIVPENAGESSSLFKVLFSILALLGGSFFVFFGLILKIFSKNGKLSLEWNAESWPYYLFPALFFLIIGLNTLSSTDSE